MKTGIITTHPCAAAGRLGRAARGVICAALASCALAAALAGDGYSESSMDITSVAADWQSVEEVSADVILPEGMTGAQAMITLNDFDGYQYQCLNRPFLAAGATNSVEFILRTEGSGMIPVGHHQAWNHLALYMPRSVSIRVFTKDGGGADCEIANVRAKLRDPAQIAPLKFSGLAQSAIEPCVYGAYEARFDLPDRFANPFDTEEIAVDAAITCPDGRVEIWPCFYYQGFYRTMDGGEESVSPQGAPSWRMRYTPRQEGVHRVRLVAMERGVTNALDDAFAFRALPPRPGARGFVRPSEKASFCLEYSDGSPYFPIGMNIRSPTDVRMNQQFPWKRRRDEGPMAYDRYFRRLGEAGANFAEVWMSAWCFGLEWSYTERGYRGVHRFNLEHAWELDRMFESAAESGININLVLNNHGRLSAHSDPEWKDNPYNQGNGGWLTDPCVWFRDARCKAYFRDQLRYVMARYGWRTNLHAYEFWSELDLVGLSNSDGFGKNLNDIRNWHFEFSKYLEDNDIYRHLRSTHFCSTYRNQSPQIVQNPFLSCIAADAYHNSQNAADIVNLLIETAKFGASFGKPTLVTEFGGSPHAAASDHLVRELRVALWSSTATMLAGGPNFWWWNFVDENDLYGSVYAPVAKYMAGEDRRDPALAPCDVQLFRTPGEPNGPQAASTDHPLRGIMVASTNMAYGWVFINDWRLSRFNQPDSLIEVRGWSFKFGSGTDGEIYRVEFYDTRTGAPVRVVDIRPRKGEADVAIPPFRSDIAFKIKRKAEPDGQH